MLKFLSVLKKIWIISVCRIRIRIGSAFLCPLGSVSGFDKNTDMDPGKKKKTLKLGMKLSSILIIEFKTRLSVYLNLNISSSFYTLINGVHLPYIKWSNQCV